MEDQYTRKYNLLLEKYLQVDSSNEKLQNRICHIRKQIRYLRKLKRLLIQKLLVYGDRFMDVCLEIPDMEPGANVEDQIIHRVAELPRPPTPLLSQQPSTSHPSVSTTISNVAQSSVGIPAAMSPTKKRRKITLTQEDGGPFGALSTYPGLESPTTVPLNRSISYQQRKSLAASNSGASTPLGFVHNRRDSADLNRSTATSTSSSSFSAAIPQLRHQVSASVEDVVNSVVFHCQREYRDKQAFEDVKLQHTVMASPTFSTPSSSHVNRVFEFPPVERTVDPNVEKFESVGNEEAIGSEKDHGFPPI